MGSERKVVAISAFAAGSSTGSYTEGVYALCNDGTVMVADREAAGVYRWYELPPIPSSPEGGHGG